MQLIETKHLASDTSQDARIPSSTSNPQILLRKPNESEVVDNRHNAAVWDDV